jgi:hypothetical protein
MAFTLASNTLAVEGYNPIWAVGGNYYYCFVASTGTSLTVGKIYMSKAPSIIGPWTVQDSTAVVPDNSNSPDDPPIGERCLTTLLSSTGRICVSYSVDSINAQVYFSAFDTSTDTWKSNYGAGSSTWTQIEAFAVVHPNQYISLAQRGNGDIVAAFQGRQDQVMGDDKWRADYNISTDDGNTWNGTTGTAIDDGGDIHYGNTVCAPGSQSTDVHFLYQRQTSTANDPPIEWADLQGKTLSTSTLSSAVTTAGASTGGQLRGLTNAISFNTGSVQRVVIGGANSSFIIERSRADEDGNNDLSAPVNETGGNVPPIKLADEASHICIIGPNPDGDIHWVYSSGTDSDVFYLTSTDDGNNLVSNNAIEIFSGVTANWPSASYVDGYGFLVVWEDGSGNTVYDFNNAFSENDVLSPTSFVTGLAGAGTALTITNVNTTNEWDDGSTNIPATGTGFYTAP